MTGHYGLVNALLREALDVANFVTITEARERDGQAALTSATGTTDAMDVILWLHRQAIVDHVGD
jgi:hypothetical protein